MRWPPLLLSLALASVARAEEAPVSPPPRQATLAVLAGAGTYEALHAGVEYHTTGHNAFELLAGTNFGIPKANVDTLGLGWRHDLAWKDLGLDPALLVRALYWTSRDDFYAWKLLSVELGGSVSKEIAPGTRITLDVAAIYTHDLESDRHQDTTFGSPTPWNASLCLSISHQLRAW